MFRQLKAIEIAEGALLADIAVVFHLIALILPVGYTFFYLLNFIIFTILVLRRGMYVGVMAMCVALFIVVVMMGPQHVSFMLLEGTGGIFLGVTMKCRMRHIPLVLLGTISGAFTVYWGLFLLLLLAGIPLNQPAVYLHQAYNAALPLMKEIATRLGQGRWWKEQLYPQITAFAPWMFAYWWVVWYFLLCVVLCPVVVGIYATTSVCVRLLGYDVRPLTGGRSGKLLQRVGRRLFKLAVRRGIVRKVWGKA